MMMCNDLEQQKALQLKTVFQSQLEVLKCAVSQLEFIKNRLHSKKVNIKMMPNLIGATTTLQEVLDPASDVVEMLERGLLQCHPTLSVGIGENEVPF